jgi:hypothetical protein
VAKEEMIYITLKQLEDSLKIAPENFRLEDPELGPVNGSFPIDPILSWQLKLKIKEDTYIQDPLNAARTIIVTYNKMAKQLSCYIYFREVNSLNRAVMADSQVTLQCYNIPILNRSYRKFQKIRKQLIKLHREKEFLDYMKKLNNIFPATHEDELFS